MTMCTYQRLCLLLACLLTAPAMARDDFTNIWIDADPACGAFSSAEVDDCWAIAHALSHPRLNVIGISTVFGNQDAKSSYQHSLRIIEKLTPADEPVPTVFPGSEVAFDQARRFSEAVEALYWRLRTQRFSILALGPVTNIAVLLYHYPALADNIDSIITVAGQGDHAGFQLNDDNRHLLFMHNRNVAADPSAMQFVLQQGINIRLIPFELGENNRFNYSLLSSLPISQNNLHWLIQTSEAAAESWRRRYGIDGFYPFDLMAAVYSGDPQQFHCVAVEASLLDSDNLFVRQQKMLSVRHSPGMTDSHIEYCYQSRIPLQMALFNAFLPQPTQFAESE